MGHTSRQQLHAGEILQEFLANCTTVQSKATTRCEGGYLLAPSKHHSGTGTGIYDWRFGGVFPAHVQ